MSKIPLPQGYGRFKVSYLACSDEHLPEERSYMQISKDEFICKLGNEIQAAFRRVSSDILSKTWGLNIQRLI